MRCDLSFFHGIQSIACRIFLFLVHTCKEGTAYKHSDVANCSTINSFFLDENYNYLNENFFQNLKMKVTMNFRENFGGKNANIFPKTVLQLKKFCSVRMFTLRFPVTQQIRLGVVFTREVFTPRVFCRPKEVRRINIRELPHFFR